MKNYEDERNYGIMEVLTIYYFFSSGALYRYCKSNDFDLDCLKLIAMYLIQFISNTYIFKKTKIQFLNELIDITEINDEYRSERIKIVNELKLAINESENVDSLYTYYEKVKRIYGRASYDNPEELFISYLEIYQMEKNIIDRFFIKDYFKNHEDKIEYFASSDLYKRIIKKTDRAFKKDPIFMDNVKTIKKYKSKQKQYLIK